MRSMQKNLMIKKKNFTYQEKNFNVLDKKPGSNLGKAACYLSHMKALKYAIDKKHDNVLILEDDCVFLAKNELNYDFNIPNDTYIYLFRGLFWPKDKPFMPIKTNVNKTNILIDTDHFKLACAVAYIIPII